MLLSTPGLAFYFTMPKGEAEEHATTKIEGGGAGGGIQFMYTKVQSQLISPLEPKECIYGQM